MFTVREFKWRFFSEKINEWIIITEHIITTTIESISHVTAKLPVWLHSSFLYAMYFT